jgi:hypothetical protein
VATWPLAAQHFCFAHNSFGRSGQSPWELRHGSAFKADRLPFGRLVSFMPSEARRDAPHKLSSPTVAGVLVGYFHFVYGILARKAKMPAGEEHVGE